MLAALGALATGQLIEHWPFEPRLYAYSVSFTAAGIAGFIGLIFLARVPEPVMRDTGPPPKHPPLLAEPFGDTGFRKVIIFMGSWNFAANLADPSSSCIC